jgi:hypothetical protein
MSALRCLSCVVMAVALAAGDPQQVLVTTVLRDGRVHVSSSVTGGLTRDMEQALQSGLTTTFTYEIDLRRAVNTWFDRGIAATTVVTSAQFDTLTGRYQVSRSVDGRIETSYVSQAQTDVAKFMTSFERLPLFSTAGLEANVEYLVRVRLRARPRVYWFPWPFAQDDAVGLARFTFIP